MAEISSYSYSTKKSEAKPRPPNVGTGSNIPDILYSFEGLERNNIVAWTTLDDEFRKTVGYATGCKMFQNILVFPCIWPFAIVCFPHFVLSKLAHDRVIRHTYWVLTTTELIIIITSHDGCCGQVVEKTKSIPLDSINDCGTFAPRTICGGASLSIIYVDTADRNKAKEPGWLKHKTFGHGLTEYDWLASEIISRRDLLRDLHSQESILLLQHEHDHCPHATVVIDRGNAESAEIRLQTVKDLHNRGIISDVEYEKKRQEIIATI